MLDSARVLNAAQESDTEVWIYRSTEKRQIVISFRGTSTPKDMLTDMALDLAAFNPSGKGRSRSPEEVAEEMSDEELENGPLGGLYKGMKASTCCGERQPHVAVFSSVERLKGEGRLCWPAGFGEGPRRAFGEPDHQEKSDQVWRQERSQRLVRMGQGSNDDAVCSGARRDVVPQRFPAGD